MIFVDVIGIQIAITMNTKLSCTFMIIIMVAHELMMMMKMDIYHTHYI